MNKTQNTIRLLCAAVVLTVLSAHCATVWETGFESSDGYSLGDIIGQDNWAVYPGIYAESPSGLVVNAVTGGSVPQGSQCLWLGPSASNESTWSAIYRPVDISGVDITADLVRVSIKAWPDAAYCDLDLREFGVGATNTLVRLLSFYGEMWVRADDNDDGEDEWVISGAPGGGYLEWHDWSILLDMYRKKLIEITAATSTWTFSNCGLCKNSAGVMANTLNVVRLMNNGDGGSSGRAED